MQNSEMEQENYQEDDFPQSFYGKGVASYFSQHTFGPFPPKPRPPALEEAKGLMCAD